MSRLVVRQGVFQDGPFDGGLGDEPVFDMAQLDKRTKLILDRLEEDAKNRRFALMIAGASALFAAVKLGIIAFPALRARVGRY